MRKRIVELSCQKYAAFNERHIESIQPPKPVKAILKVEKNRDGKTGKTNLYFDYPRSRILTNEEYMDEFGEVMKI